MSSLLPPAIASAITHFSRVIPAWAAASGYPREDVEQDVCESVLMGKDPAREVPRRLRIRKIGGAWRPLDALPAASALGDYDVAAGDDEALHDDASGIAAALTGGSDHVAARCGVGRRAAQLRLKAQLARFETSGDLFATGGE
ncbi:MAG: hypothetical protein H6943_05080 [Zoogloeaceae bacterium]|nr:hypothetical protein [Zoogloeaceae bacterium]